ncbi:MAG: peptidylprolyl isomerase [Chitinophagaceae bacterium]|nr:peptidylprolyl isomerase [Chitinophagaceae bacterium]
MKQLLLLMLVGLPAFFVTVHGQENSSRLLVDNIVAVVGDKIVLRSDVENMAADVKRHQGAMPDEQDCAFLGEIIMRKALVIQAQKDSIFISDDEVEAELEQRIRYFINLYGSKEALEQIAGKTTYQVKEDSRELIKEQKQVEALQRMITERVTVTPDEVKKYYYDIPKDSLQFYEAGYELGQIVLYAHPDEAMEKHVKDDLEALRKRIEKREIAFKTVARLYSDDTDTKANGGLMEYNRNDKLIEKELRQYIFSLKEGQLSRVIKSQSGYHLLESVSRNGDDATVRHIFKKVPVTPEALHKTVVLLDTIRFRLVGQSLSFAEAVDRYSEDPSGKFTAGAITNIQGESLVTIADLDKSIVAVLDKLKVGEYSTPVLFTDEQGRQGARILYVRRKAEPHIENLKDDYEKIARRLVAKKKEETLRKWFSHHLPGYYVNVTGHYRDCGKINSWLKK